MLKQRLQQKLLQKLSPQQIQMIKLLEIPAVQMEQRIKKELEENPVLEEGNDEEIYNEDEEGKDEQAADQQKGPETDEPADQNGHPADIAGHADEGKQRVLYGVDLPHRAGDHNSLHIAHDLCSNIIGKNIGLIYHD